MASLVTVVSAVLVLSCGQQIHTTHTDPQTDADERRCLSVRPSVCRVLRLNSRMERPRKPKIGTMEANQTGNP